MTATPDLARCPSCGNYVDADDMTDGQCPVCAGPEPVDPWAGQFVPAAAAVLVADQALELRAERDQARRFAAAWQGEAEAYREVVEALTHSFVGHHATCHRADRDTRTECRKPPDHPVHRTIAVIQAELQPDDTPDFDPGQVPASTGEQR